MTHPLLSRVVADSQDPAAWHAARVGKIGASDAAGFAKVESVEKYVRAKLMPNRFEGNTFTKAGHAWEPSLTAYARVPHNTLMFRHADVPEFVATPDGVLFAGDKVALSECKVKHRPTKGPTPAELRQVAWAQLVCGAEATAFVWLVLDPDTGQPVDMEPRKLIIDRDEKIITGLLNIAYPVLKAMRAAAEFESGLS